MTPFKKDLSPLTKGGKIDKHEGKGSRQGLLPSRGAQPRAPANTMNDYAKATPNLSEAAGGFVSGGPIPCSRAHPCAAFGDDGGGEG